MYDKRLSVIEESKTGRNTLFLDNLTNEILRGKEIAKRLLDGYGHYYIRNINGIPTIVSKPDNSIANNLG